MYIVYKTEKPEPDKLRVAQNQWPVFSKRNCLFTAGSKSIFAFASKVHPYKCHTFWLPSSNCAIHVPSFFFDWLVRRIAPFFCVCSLHNGWVMKRWRRCFIQHWWCQKLEYRECTFVPTCRHLHVTSQSADPPLTSSAGQEDSDDGQQGAHSQQSTATGAQHCTGLQTKQT